MYHFFLDESGYHDLEHIDEKFPLLVLCGCLLDDAGVRSLDLSMTKLKVDVFGRSDIILHSYEIRRHKGDFACLFDRELRERFYAELNKVIAKTDFKIIAAVIDKRKYADRYGDLAGDPYHLSVDFLIERLIYCLDDYGKDAHVTIKAEMRGKKHDQGLARYYELTCQGKTMCHVKPDRIERRIKKLWFHSKSENLNGLQLADLCAYPIGRYVLNPSEQYPPFEIIRTKFHRSKRGKVKGYGLKVFP